MSLVHRLKHWIYLSDPDMPEDVRRSKSLVRRLDAFFMLYAAFSAVIKYLDQTNISNAYVSGMKEDINVTGNQYNLFTTFFNIGYIIVIPFSTYFINRTVRPSLWMPIAELVWGIGTAGMAAAKTPQQVFGLRFLVGIGEGTAWPGTMVLLLSWYTPSEIGKRMAIYNGATTLGGIFSGALQAALYTNLNGAGGLSGWRWLFVVNACITVVVAVFGFIACPDYPNKPNPWSKLWLKPEHIETALTRMKHEKREMPKGWSWKTIKSVVSRPQNWAVFITYELLGQGGTGTTYFNLWLKSLKNANGTARYTVQQLNTIPIAGSVINIVSLFFFLTLSDIFRTRWPFLLIVAFIGIIFSAVLTAWYVADGAIMASFLILNAAGVYANLTVSWLGDLVKHSAEERSFIVAAFPVTFYTLGAGVPLKVWPASQAPHYKIGWKYPLIMYNLAIPALFATVFFERRQKRLDALRDGDEKFNTGNGSYVVESGSPARSIEDYDSKSVDLLDTPPSQGTTGADGSVNSSVSSSKVTPYELEAKMPL